MTKKKKGPVVTKTPDGTTGMKLEHEQVVFGNVDRLLLTIGSNLNTTLLEVLRELQEIKKILKDG